MIFGAYSVRGALTVIRRILEPSVVPVCFGMAAVAYLAENKRRDVDKVVDAYFDAKRDYFRYSFPRASPLEINYLVALSEDICVANHGSYTGDTSLNAVVLRNGWQRKMERDAKTTKVDMEYASRYSADDTQFVRKHFMLGYYGADQFILMSAI